MASSAGRRNILRELNSPSASGIASQVPVVFPPTPTSPEEEVIKRRGRRKALQYDVDESPVKIPGRYNSPKKKQVRIPTTPTRSSPRKRLNLSSSESPNADEEFSELTSLCRKGKRLKINGAADGEMNLEKSLIALSHGQLVELVRKAASSSPDVKKVLENLVPEPDLTPLEERLHFLRKNVLKAYPRNVWGSQDDAFCYLRVRIHIDTFKKECIEQCLNLVESENWLVVIEYVLTALSYTRSLPHWANAVHNKTKETCIHQLTTHLMNAIKNCDLDQQILLEISERISSLQMDKLNECKLLIDAQLRKV